MAEFKYPYRRRDDPPTEARGVPDVPSPPVENWPVDYVPFLHIIFGVVVIFTIFFAIVGFIDISRFVAKVIFG